MLCAGHTGWGRRYLTVSTQLCRYGTVQSGHRRFYSLSPAPPCEHSLLSYLTFVGLAAQHFTRLLSEIYDGSQMAAANELTICFGIRLHLFGTITNIKP